MYDSSNGDDGLAYFWNPLNPPEYWTLLVIGDFLTDQVDLLLQEITLLTYEENPSDVSLEVNGTEVTDYGYYSFGGSVSFNELFDGRNGQIFLDVSADEPVFYSARWTCLFSNQSYALTSYIGYSLGATIAWNITLYAKYPEWNFSQDGVGSYFLKVINITFPIDHSIHRVYFNNVPYAFWTFTQSGNKKFLVILGKTGNWRIHAYSPNYITEVHAYNGTMEAAEFFVGEEINVTAKFKSATGIGANLTIYNRYNQLLNTSTAIPGGIWVKFPLWKTTQNGTHYLIVNWFNGTEVGIKSINVMCNYHTNLSKKYPNPNIDLGIINTTNPIKFSMLYYDIDNGQGIPGAKSYITVNITPFTVVEYSKLLFPGYYNLTIFTSLLTNGNWTAHIQAWRAGYARANLYVHFRIEIGANATLNVTEGARFVDSKWWVDPDPYFDDQTHTVTVYYANGTSPYEGIEYAQIVGIPNWKTVTWYGSPTNTTPGFYDLPIDTQGLHEGDTGRIRITAFSQYFETRSVDIYVYIIEIPTTLLLIDAGEYSNVTCYEGETIDIAVGYWDDFHEKPILFENSTMGNLTWHILGTLANGTLGKSVWQYEDTLSLPQLGIFGTKTYKIEITAMALRDYATYKANLTLNVLSKENTTLTITNSTPTEYRVGHSCYIYGTLKFENGTKLVGKIITFNISLWNEGGYKSSFLETRTTDSNGVATYYYSEIPDEIDMLRINGSYSGTEKIDPAVGFQQIPIGPKYNVTLLVSNYTLHEYRVGQDLYLQSILFLENGTYLVNYPILFNVSFYEGSTLKYNDTEIKFTNTIGKATYYVAEIPDNVDTLIFTATFAETQIIEGISNSTIIPIKPKYNTTLTILSEIPTKILVGKILSIEVLLWNEEADTGIANATIEVVLIYNGHETTPRTATTNSQGIGYVEIEIPSEMANYDSFYVEIRYDGSTVNQKSTVQTETEIIINTWTKIIIGFLPYIAIGIAAVLGSYLSYRQFVAVPRRRRRLTRMLKIASKFSDIINVQHILTIHSGTGSCIFQHSFGEVNFDADLISGFLTAISAFQTEFQAPTQKVPFTGEKLLETEKRETGFELNYADFKILLKDGEFTRTALILSITPTESLRRSLNEYVSLFEQKYGIILESWKGAMAPFQDAEKVVEQAFETSLLWPHTIETEDPKFQEEIKKLNSLESSLVTLALTIQTEKWYFFLPSLVQKAEGIRRETHVEILGTIDDLRQKGIFKAITIEELGRRLHQ
ncbi:MAG TPA: hypothetical protein VMV49_11685 [Candidatus Deferrimicrobium sp.]|nr:hypothetical protein [Candidatus Deferrimicrobium sp.]